VIGDEPGRPRELAHVRDEVDRIGRTRREKVAGSGHENLFGWPESNA
jgi:hypothetical protein